MTAEEKAKELVGRFMEFTPAEEEYEYPYAIECALIAVDEIMKACLPIGARNGDERKKEIFWNEVKQHLIQMKLNIR